MKDDGRTKGKNWSASGLETERERKRDREAHRARRGPGQRVERWAGKGSTGGYIYIDEKERKEKETMGRGEVGNGWGIETRKS